MNEISNFLIKRRSGQEIKAFFDKEDLEKVIKAANGNVILAVQHYPIYKRQVKNT